MVVQNLSQMVTVNLLTLHFQSMSVGLMFAVSGALVGLSVLMRHWCNKISYTLDSKRTERQLEKTQVESESAVEKVKVLEAKIETLEKALDEALKTQEAV